MLICNKIKLNININIKQDISHINITKQRLDLFFMRNILMTISLYYSIQKYK